MVRGGGQALPDLVRDLLHRALTLPKHVDDLGPPSAAQRRRHRRERVVQSGLRNTLTHKIKLPFESVGVNAPISRAGRTGRRNISTAFKPESPPTGRP